ncbi:hypothetical protein ACH5RR_023579 [Cinchona calisaya]|uniref:SWIM-type domain-containing protein n=1 Tax=Cinchona calisaya TaxID=153742 RepID=A0ABD2ZEY0_9GENT
MDWIIRKRELEVDPYKLYGQLRGKQFKTYVGGEVDHIDDCNAERMSVHEINIMVQELGHKEAIFYYYLEPKTSLDKGLRNLQGYSDVLGMCKWVCKYKLIDVYCDHRPLSEIFEETVEDFNEANQDSDTTSDDEHLSDDDEYCVDEVQDSDTTSDDEHLSDDDEYCVDEVQHVNVTIPEDEQTGKENRKKRKQGNNNRSARFAAQPDPSNAGGKSDVEDLLGDNMVDDELHSTYGSSEEDVEHNLVRYVDFRTHRDMRQPKFEQGLDGCHIKGPYTGQLLTAIAVDPNNGWWLVAWALVERKAIEQWRWFLELLRDDLEVQNQSHYTFISDQQKGLDRALSEVLPNSEHRYCVQHMYRNFKRKHPGKALKNLLWAIARRSSIELFNKAMDKMRDFDRDAFEWVKKAPHPSHWCKSFFLEHTKCDILVNNLSESFNSHILDARDKPVISMLESIREIMMERTQKRRDGMCRLPGHTRPLIRKIIEDRIEESSLWRTIWNGGDEHQVKGPRDAQFAIKIKKKQCTCRLWHKSGLPCVHAIVALKVTDRDPHKETNDYYSRELFLDPSIPAVQPGRPTKARRRDVTKGKSHGKKLAKNVVMHFSKCGETGHNAATCKKKHEKYY